MRMIPLTAALLSLGFAPVPLRKPDPAKDLQKLQGEWALTGSSTGGPVRPQAGSETAVFTGDRVSFRSRGREGGAWAVVLGASRTMDLKGPGGVSVLGLYRLDGDRLTLCYTNELAARDRPTDLEPGRGRMVQVYERKRPR
jgi:uncharacterized protein (TIGR03067 family)